MIDEELSMVPDLVVLLVVESYFIDPGYFSGDGGVECKECGCPVEPDGVVCGIHGDDVFSEFENAGRVFFCCHYCSEIAHC